MSKAGGSILRWLLLLALLALAVGTAGCASDDADMSSARPWNRPNGWNSGIPEQLLEGR
ncbi:MAG TPA: hypothetical protein VHH73_16595 [Verrucomicrobiae bacterium]|nr:hypothetical protein [Verrucomicrobiae bacterium]